MTFLGGHTANLPLTDAYHMHIAMFVARGHDFFTTEHFRYNTRWGHRCAFISGTAGGFLRTVGAINNDTYLERANRQFWNHLYTGVGMVEQMFDARNYFMNYHSRTFPWNGRWTNSTSFTIGLVNAMGLNHGLSSAQVARATGIGNAFAARYFGIR